jgi:hypothetical protein
MLLGGPSCAARWHQSPATGIEAFVYEAFPTTLGKFGRSGGFVAAT